MSTIQDIRALELQITDVVDDYIQQMYNEDDDLTISLRYGWIKVAVDAQENIKVGKTTELYPLKNLIRTDDDDNPESDCDNISDISNSWVCLN